MTQAAPPESPSSHETEQHRFANAHAREHWSGYLTTRSGLRFYVTPARPGDGAALESFFNHVSAKDLYYRFLTGIRKIDKSRIEAMTREDDPLSIDFLALDEENGKVLATAMLAADEAFDTAEFAMCTRGEAKHKGLSWTLLDHVARYAEAMGMRKIQSIESWEDKAALTLEREMGFTVRTDPDDATLMIAEKTFG